MQSSHQTMRVSDFFRRKKKITHAHNWIYSHELHAFTSPDGTKPLLE